MYETQKPSRQFIIHIRALGSLIQKTDIDKVAVYYIGENNVALDKHKFKLPQTPVVFFQCLLLFL